MMWCPEVRRRAAGLKPGGLWGVTTPRIRVGLTQAGVCKRPIGEQIGSATGTTSMAQALVPRVLTL